MKRKMLISIALITIMLLNCMMPLLVVHADVSDGEEIQLNSTLYYAVVNAINCVENNNVKYKVNEGTHTITISAEEIAKVKCLDLAGCGINDLTNLDKFTSLETLVLSSNDLYSGEESNLKVLDNLTNLIHLNLSENHLDSVADIPATMERLFNSKNGTILLSGQIVNKVVAVDMDTVTENATLPETVTVQVPEILSLAGDLKSVWKTKEGYTQDENPRKVDEQFLRTYGLPYIDYEKFADLYKVGPNSNSITVTVADDFGNPYYGMLRYTIEIVDEKGESGLAANLNKASENPLYESVFNIYVVVKDASSEAISMIDENLYYAIKEQLTGGQTVNKKLSSYPYVVDMNGETIYVEYVFSTTNIDGVEYQVLTEVGKENPSYYYNATSKKLYEYISEDSVGREVYDVALTAKTIEIENKENGEITKRKGYVTPFKAEDTGDTMYISAYDDAYTFVIDDKILTNGITSLILNGKKIQYLEGLQYFVGLSSELDLSYNYLDGIKELGELQAQKDHWEEQLVENYLKWLKEREKGNLTKSASELTKIEEAIEAAVKENKELSAGIIKLMREAAQLTGKDAEDEAARAKYEEELKKKADGITEQFKKIHGYMNDNGEHVDGIFDKLDKLIRGNAKEKGVVQLLGEVYAYLGHLYEVYNDEYKMTTLLADSVNYMTYTEYEEYEEALKTFEGSKKLGDEQISHIKKLEAEDALSSIDMDLILTAYPEITAYMMEDEEKPIAAYFDDQEYNHVGYKVLLKEFRMIALYSELTNYCLIKRMNQETATGYCYETDYLEKRIAELKVEGIPTDYEDAMLARLKEETVDLEFLDSYYLEELFTELTTAYIDYRQVTYNYGENVSLTSGKYYDVEEIGYTKTIYTDEEVQSLVLPEGTNGDYSQALEAYNSADGADKSIIKKLNLVEQVNGVKGQSGQLVIYDQLMTLVRKLVNGNVERYIQLPDLKKLNVAENGHLDDFAGLTELKSLVELNGDHCAFSDVDSINWGDLPNLKRLSLSHNGIETLDPFVKLKNIRYLDLSKNNISGKIDIDSDDFPTFFDDLEYLNLAENKITDIRSIQLYLDGITNGNYGEYLKDTDDFVLNLQKQNIVINIEDPIIYDPSIELISVDLTDTKLFTQLKAIDTKRTAFGMNSEHGSINSEGTNILIDVTKDGKHVAIANVENIDSNALVEDYCVGYGSKITINYEVLKGKVTNVNITPRDEVTVKVGETLQFTAEVEGEILYTEEVDWAVLKNVSAETTITEEGLLTVAEDETAADFLVRATPKADTSAYKFVKVIVEPASEEGGEEPIDPESPGTADPENPGTTDPENPGTTNPEDEVIDTASLGYTIGEEYLTGVSAKTPVNDFKEILLNGKEYNVVVKKDGETITEGNMTTGMFVQLQDEDGNLVKDTNGDLVVYEVVVKGDVNGDGLANSLDSMLIKAYRNDVTDLAGATKAAADLNNDGRITLADSKLLLYHRAEVTGYNLNYVK